MPAPSLNTTWPTTTALKAYLSENAISATVEAGLLESIMSTASADVYMQLDPDKLPADTDACPHVVSQAILITAARLLFRRQAPHGFAALGAEQVARLRAVDVDVERLIGPYTPDAMP